MSISPSLDLTYVCVEGLNGFLKHEVNLNKDGITILHGVNGSGKTSFLEIIKNFFYLNFDEVIKYDFEKLTFKFDNANDDFSNSFHEETIVIEQKIVPLDDIFSKIPESIHKSIDDSDFKVVVLNTFWNGRKLKEKILYTYDEDVDDDLEIRFRKMISRNDDIKIEGFEIVIENDSDRVGQFLNIKKIIGSSESDLDDELEKDFNNFVNFHKVYMINTQRLINILKLNESRRRDRYGRMVRERDPLESHLMIENHAKNMSSQISKSFAESTEKTKITDQSFPQRLIQVFKEINEESIDDIRDEYSATERKISRILKAGLLLREKNISLPSEDFDDTYIKKVLRLYLQDLNEKLDPYKDILEKIEAFQEIIGSKIRNKEMKINHEDGFYFESKVNNKKLKLKNLSSGEQHQIVLFFELIFLANSGTYYLIDEPEISLHVDWQRSFLDDIARVERLRGHKFIIATHSPQVIGSRRSLCVALDGGIL